MRKSDTAVISKRMDGRPFKPDAFALGMLGFGMALLLFPLMRMAALSGVIAAVVYWLILGLLRLTRNKP